MAQRKVIIDSDGGVDDAIAILVALKHCEVLALTSVFGNTSCEQVAKNLCRVVGIHRASGNSTTTRVYRGCVHPFMATERPDSWPGHGGNGLGDSHPEAELECHIPSMEEEHAVNAMIQLVQDHPNQIDLIAIGPLTNVALAYNLFPEFFRQLRSLYIMGGSYTAKGNFTMTAEYNFYSDPESAKIVLMAAPLADIPVVLVPWEPCEATDISWKEYDVLTSYPTLRSKFLKNICRSMESYCRPDGDASSRQDKRYGFEFVLCDVNAVIALLFPQSIQQEMKAYVEVDTTSSELSRGMLAVDWYNIHDSQRPKVTIVHQMVSSFIWDVVRDVLKD